MRRFLIKNLSSYSVCKINGTEISFNNSTKLVFWALCLLELSILFSSYIFFTMFLSLIGFIMIGKNIIDNEPIDFVDETNYTPEELYANSLNVDVHFSNTFLNLRTQKFRFEYGGDENYKVYRLLPFAIFTILFIFVLFNI